MPRWSGSVRRRLPWWTPGAWPSGSSPRTAPASPTSFTTASTSRPPGGSSRSGCTEVLGNPYLGDKHGGGPFTEHDLTLIRVLATESGIALTNARLYEAARQREPAISATPSGSSPNSSTARRCSSRTRHRPQAGPRHWPHPRLRAHHAPAPAERRPRRRQGRRRTRRQHPGDPHRDLRAPGRHLVAALREGLSNAFRHADASRIDVVVDANVTCRTTDRGYG
jgi:hypothetical protein